MIDLLLIPIAAICNRWRGGGIYRFEWEKRLEELENWTTWHELTPFPLTEYAKLKTRSKWLARKLISGVVLAAICALFAKNIWVAPIILVGWYIINLVGTGDGFAAIHGGYDGMRKYNVWNRWVYWVADKITGLPVLHPQEPELKSDSAKHNCRWGRWLMTFRGIYVLPTAIALAFLFQNLPDTLWGLLGVLSGWCYYLGGRTSKKNAVCVAEYLNGAIYGIVLFAILS